jgi:uncharacterized protein YndB with AHSA1/START domain
MGTRLLLILSLALSCGPAFAGERVLRHEKIVHAPVSEVWKAFTTSEGTRHWMAPSAVVDLRIGGTIKTNYKEGAKPDDPGTIVHHVLSYEPERMLSTQFTAPEGVSGAPRTAEAIWWVARMEPLPDGSTRVTYTGVGWGEGADWDAAYRFFDRGNAYTLDQLAKYLEKKN